MLKRRYAIKTKEFADTDLLSDYTGKEYEIAVVYDDGDGKPAQYQYYDSSWHKIADPDWGVGGGAEVVYPTYHDISEQCDGNTTVFTLPNAAHTDSILLFACGLAMKPGTALDNGDFIINSSTELEFHEAPANGTNVIVYYVEA